MDPLTQASLGAAAAALISRRSNVRLAIAVGALAGAAPDLDVFIHSESDPLLALEYHRHFTHSLLFAPIIGLLVAALFKAIFYRKDWPFRDLALFGMLGALSHGLLDACTSYGTLLYLPFSSHRESWDIISIIDPVFTLPLFFLTLVAFALGRPRFVKGALVFCLLYLGFGLYQREQAEQFAHSLAESRGHVPIELTVRPSFANTLLWRIIYRHESRYYVDAVSLLPGKPPQQYAGQSVDAFTEAQSEAMLPEGSVLASDVARFRFFSQGYLYRHPDDPAVVGDLRYAMFPDSIEPLWGIYLNPKQSDRHTDLVYFREPSQRSFDRLWSMVQGISAANLAVSEN